MLSSIRRTLWGFVTALALLIVVGVVMTMVVVQRQRREDYVLLQVAQPLLSAVATMNEQTESMLASSRGYVLTGETQFLQRYDDAVRDFETAASRAYRLAGESRSRQMIVDYRRHVLELKRLCDYQITLARDGRTGNAAEAVLEGARLQRLAPDYLRTIEDEVRSTMGDESAYNSSLGQWLLAASIIGAILVLAGAALMTRRVEQSLYKSMRRESRRREAIIGGMTDGVMLLDRDGTTLFINPAGEALLGTGKTGVPLAEQAATYGLHNTDGSLLTGTELPAAASIARGERVDESTLLLRGENRESLIAMHAVPLFEEGRSTFVVVTFRDVTERRRLEERLQLQAESAQVLADASAYFTSKIDPAWVVQAIAERVAEVLGDWAAVTLTSGSGAELRVAAIHHREPSQLGLAWSYIYRQPLVVGEGLIGQAIASRTPSLVSNVGGSRDEQIEAPPSNGTKTASVLVLPLSTQREVLGALVIAATDPSRAMNDERLVLAQALAERASLAIDNANLYTEQVEARRKVEDLSRLKDEFLSIASHELRTPVTSIKGYTQLAKTLIGESDLATAEEYLGIALDQIDRMSRLIVELLDVSRIETGRLEIRREEIDWAGFVREVVERRYPGPSRKRIRVAAQGVRTMVLGDRDRLEQVLANLLENALKYSPDDQEVSVCIQERGEQLLTMIEDSGIGIPPDEMPNVFERFHRGRMVSSTNYGGLGLGLYIARQIVDRHGGTIWAEGRPGGGSVFSFTLPGVSAAETQPS